MKFFILVAIASGVSPLEKCIQLMDQLTSKVMADGEAEKALYEKFEDWCKDETVSNQYTLKTAQGKAEELQALIAKETGRISSLSSSIADLAATTTRNQKDLEAAIAIREKEHSDFVTADAELGEDIDQLARAMGILRKNMAATGFAQTNIDSVLSTLQLVLQASSVKTEDKAKLQGFLQASSGDDDDFLSRSAPAAAAYKTHSGAIFDVLEDMKSKASALRKEGQESEMKAQHSFNLLKQSLETAIAQDGKELDAAKKAKAVSEEAKAMAEGDLGRTQDTIAETTKYLSDVATDCQEKAADHEASTKSREEELAALAEAKKVISGMTGGAAAREYDFMQVSEREAVRVMDPAKEKIVTLLQKLGREYSDTMLTQFAVKVKTTVLMGGDDVFAKVKSMIQGLLDKLVEEAQAEASHKAWCDKETAETKAKIDDHTSKIETLSTRADKADATIEQLKSTIATLESEIADLIKTQATMDSIRAEEKAAFAASNKDYDDGIEGLTIALKVLRDYYAEKETEAFVQQPATAVHSKSGDAATGIIGLLEVCQSDFMKSKATGEVQEETAQKEYERISNENAVSKASKETELTFSKKEKTSTERLLGEIKGDKEQEDAELSAVLEYQSQLTPACVAKAETYEERKSRRTAEIAGLKEALSILEGESP